MLEKLEDIIIVTGHYGSGKTNLSVNLAVDLQLRGKQVALADLDIVNPYFRTADFADVAEEHGFELVIPPFANTNLDIPALPALVDAKLETGQTVVLDVGGDDAGAFALGRYAPRIQEKPYSMLYVLNRFRPLTEGPEQAFILMKEIEAASRLKVNYLVNNSNLSYETTLRDVKDSITYAEEVSRLSGVPVLFTSLEERLYRELEDRDGYYPLDIYVKAPWLA